MYVYRYTYIHLRKIPSKQKLCSFNTIFLLNVFEYMTFFMNANVDLNLLPHFFPNSFFIISFLTLTCGVLFAYFFLSTSYDGFSTDDNTLFLILKEHEKKIENSNKKMLVDEKKCMQCSKILSV